MNLLLALLLKRLLVTRFLVVTLVAHENDLSLPPVKGYLSRRRGFEYLDVWLDWELLNRWLMKKALCIKPYNKTLFIKTSFFIKVEF